MSIPEMTPEENFALFLSGLALFTNVNALMQIV
jgi:hypothetical protein